jgi:Zn-dependent protease
MYIPPGSLTVEKGRFSRTELVHLGISLSILTVAFSFAYSPLHQFDSGRFLNALPLALLGILTAFFVHELAHKFVAQKYGLWSEYRMFPLGLMLSLLFAAFFGVVFAAPGAVMFRGGVRPQEMGRIAAAGPLANIGIAAVALALSIPFPQMQAGSFSVGNIILFVCFINALLAFFNLFPIGPLDGKKVFQWHGLVWAVLFVCAILLILENVRRGIFFGL